MKCFVRLVKNGNYEIWEDTPEYITQVNYLDELPMPLVVLDRYTWKLFTDNEPSPKESEIIPIEIKIDLGWHWNDS